MAKISTLYFTRKEWEEITSIKEMKPQYYIHMRIDDIWYCLWKMKYQENQNSMKPVWWEENQLGERTPHLYSSLAVARNVIERCDLDTKEAEVAVWSNDDASV